MSKRGRSPRGRKTGPEEVARLIREWILRSDEGFKPDETVTGENILKKLGKDPPSGSTARTAVHLLVAEGVLIYHPNDKVVVRRLDAVDIEKMLGIRFDLDLRVAGTLARGQGEWAPHLLSESLDLMKQAVADLRALLRPLETKEKELEQLIDAMRSAAAAFGQRQREPRSRERWFKEYFDNLFELLSAVAARREVEREPVENELKRHRVAFLVADAEFHVGLARLSRLDLIERTVRTCHTYPSIQYLVEVVKEALAAPELFLRKLNDVIGEHEELVSAIEEARAAGVGREPERMDRVERAVFIHLVQTITRWLAPDKMTNDKLAEKLNRVLVSWPRGPGYKELLSSVLKGGSAVPS